MNLTTRYGRNQGKSHLYPAKKNFKSLFRLLTIARLEKKIISEMEEKFLMLNGCVKNWVIPIIKIKAKIISFILFINIGASTQDVP